MLLSNSQSDQNPGQISFLQDGLNFTLINSTSFNAPWREIVDYWNGQIYISNFGDSSVSVLDPSNNSVSTIPNIFGNTGSLALSSTGQTLYFLNTYQYRTHLSVINLTNDKLISNESNPGGLSIACNPANGNILIPNGQGLKIFSGNNYSLIKKIQYIQTKNLFSYTTNEQILIDNNTDKLYFVTPSELVVINTTTYTEEANLSATVAGINVTFLYAALDELHNLIFISGTYSSGGVLVAAYNLSTLSPVWYVYRHAFRQTVTQSPDIAYDPKDNVLFLVTQNLYDLPGEYELPALVVLNGSTGHISSMVNQIPYEVNLDSLSVVYDKANGLAYILMGIIFPSDAGNVIAVRISGNGNYGPTSSELVWAQILRYVSEGLAVLAILAAVWIPYSYIESRSLRKKP